MKKSIQSIITICLVVAVVMTSGILSYAEYTRSSRARRVVAPYDDTGSLFSSNYLLQGESVRNFRTIYFSSAESRTSANISICNYAQGNPSKTYDRDINYRITVKLVTYVDGVKQDVTAGTAETLVGDITYGIALQKNSDGTTTEATLSKSRLSVSVDSTLQRLQASQDVCVVSFDPALLECDTGLCLEVVATPTDGFLDIATLGGLFNVGLGETSSRLLWEGYLNEAGARGGIGPDPDELDGFNYCITGNGSGTCTLKWRTDKLDLSQVFMIVDISPDDRHFDGNVESETIEGHTWSSITFDVDSSDEYRYDTQFYRASGVSDEEVTGWNWSTVEGYIDFAYAE